MRIFGVMLGAWLFFAGGLGGAEPVALRARQLAREATAAAQRGDHTARLELSAEAVRLMPDHARYWLGLALAHAARGEPQPAVQALGRIAELGQHVDLNTLEPLAALRSREDFQAVGQRLARLLEPVGRGEVAFGLPEVSGLIEGVAWRARTGECFFGDVHRRAIWRRSPEGRVTRFDTDAGAPGGVFGLRIDEERGALWAATSVVPEMQGFSAERKGQAGVAEFDLASGALRRVVWVPADGREHAVGDLLLARDGTVFATDSAAPVLWRLAPGGRELIAWIEHPEFLSLQGLAWAVDERALYVAAYGNGLLRVDPASREVTRLAPPQGTTLLGLDGLERWGDDALVAVQNGLAPPRVVRLALAGDGRAVTAVNTLESGHPGLRDPTLLCATAEGLLVIGDAGWRNFEGGRTAATPPRSVSVYRVRPAPAVTRRVTTVAEVVAAVNRAEAGDEIVLAPGEYRDLTVKLAASGRAGRPITLRAEQPGGAVLTGSPGLEVTGDYWEVRGLAFKGCSFQPGTRGAVNFNGAGHGRLTECTFEDSSLPGGAALVAFRHRAHDNRVDHCRFLRTRYRAVVVVVDDGSLKDGPPRRNRIDHNLFQDVPPLQANGAETIQIGQRAIPHSDLRPETLVEHNEFVRCDGEAEIISVKTSGNTIRENVFRDSRGELVMRHGHGNLVTGNRFFGGSGGIRLSGHGHIVTGNTMTGCRGTGIRLYYGTPDLKHPASYLPVYDCVITDNTITDCGQMGILVGDAKDARHENAKWAGPPWFSRTVMECTVAPQRNRIANNTVTGKPGRLLQAVDAPDNTITGNTLHERP